MADKPEIDRWALAPHAATRIAERGITTAELDQVIRAPDHALRQGPKWLLAKQIKGRSDNLVAAVVLQKEESDLWIVLTVMVHFEIIR